MKRNIIKSLAILALAAMLAMTTTACAQSNDEAKNVLRLSREKCKSIQQGHYVMEHWKKFVSDKDTNLTIYTCDFRKVRRDRLFGMVFAMQDENPGHPEWNGYTLYTGEEFVTYSDSTGEVMSCKKWKNEIKSIRHNYTFYEALTKRSCDPLPDDKQLADNSYTYYISDTTFDNKPCQLVGYRKTDWEPNKDFGTQTIRVEVRLWIEKLSLLPIQYTIEIDIVEQADTLHQYDRFKLLSLDTVIDESKLTLASVPASVKLKDYEPYEEPEPLAEGTMAPDWSLPTLTGDTVRLADLRGKVVLLDFFYKSCAPCCAALPFLQSIHEKYKDKGVVLLGIDPIDDPVKDEMADFLAKRSVTYTVLFSDRELSSTYHIVGYPTLFFIDHDGKIAKVQSGYHPTLEATIEEQLQKLLE